MRWWNGVVGALTVCARLAVAADSATIPSSILIDASNGEVLREQDADAARSPGALSDLMLLLLSLEEAALGVLPLDVPVTVSSDAASAAAGPARRGAHTVNGNRVVLRSDRAYLLGDLLKAMLISSADDAAVATAEAIAGSVPAALELMNVRAQKLGMAATHFGA